MVDLGGLSDESSYALAISADGRVIVGYAFPGDSNDNHVFRRNADFEICKISKLIRSGGGAQLLISTRNTCPSFFSRSSRSARS